MKPIVLAVGIIGAIGLVALASGKEPERKRYHPQSPLPNYDSPPSSPEEAKRRFQELIAVRPDARTLQVDGYSQRLWNYDLGGMGVFARDEYGRYYQGVSPDPLGTVLTAAGIVLPFVPGVGPAASAAIAAAVAIGKGESLHDATLKAARAALPAPAQVAFDMGVGVVYSGKPIDQAALDATLGKIPGGKQAYEKAVALAT